MSGRIGTSHWSFPTARLNAECSSDETGSSPSSVLRSPIVPGMVVGFAFVGPKKDKSAFVVVRSASHVNRARYPLKLSAKGLCFGTFAIQISGNFQKECAP